MKTTDTQDRPIICLDSTKVPTMQIKNINIEKHHNLKDNNHITVYQKISQYQKMNKSILRCTWPWKRSSQQLQKH